MRHETRDTRLQRFTSDLLCETKLMKLVSKVPVEEKKHYSMLIVAVMMQTLLL